MFGQDGCPSTFFYTWSWKFNFLRLVHGTKSGRLMVNVGKHLTCWIRLTSAISAVVAMAALMTPFVRPMLMLDQQDLQSRRCSHHHNWWLEGTFDRDPQPAQQCHGKRPFSLVTCWAPCIWAHREGRFIMDGLLEAEPLSQRQGLQIHASEGGKR